MENEVKLRNYHEVARGCRNYYLLFGNLDYKERLVRRMFFSVVYFIFDRCFTQFWYSHYYLSSPENFSGDQYIIIYSLLLYMYHKYVSQVFTVLYRYPIPIQNFDQPIFFLEI